MASFISVPVTPVMPEKNIYLQINDVVYGHWIKIYVVRELNGISIFEVKLYNITPTEKADIAEGNIVRFFISNKLWLKGKIESADYETDQICVIKGKGMEIKLIEKLTDRATFQYENTAGNTIVIDTCSGVINIGTNDYTEAVSFRGEFDNKLAILRGYAKATNSDWWVDQDTSDNDQFNISGPFEDNKQKGSASSVKTYYTSGVNQNIVKVNYVRDKENMFNKVTVLGYGDGMNQIYSTIFHATTNRTYLNQAAGYITATDSTITVDDASVLPATGTVWIGMEKISYTGKSGNDLTGCGRGVSGGLAAYRHNNNTEVWDAQYTETSSQAGSSITVVGSVKETEITDRTIMDQDTLDKIAQRFLKDHNGSNTSPYMPETITLDSLDVMDDAYDITTGDVVTINDTNTELSSSEFRCMKQELLIDYESGVESLNMIFSNVKPGFLESLTSTSDEVVNLNKYMQGATNIFALSEKENCDASYPLNMRFYIPEDAIAINKVLLKFTTQKFRANTTASQTSAAGSSHTHSVTVSSSGAHDHNLAHCIAAWPTGGFPNSSGVGTTLNAAGHTHGAFTSASESAHTHSLTMTFGIYETTFTVTSVVVEAGVEGYESAVTGSPFTVTDGGTYSVDITTLVAAVGAGNWCNIKFTPNAKVRIEANAYLKIFIKSVA